MPVYLAELDLDPDDPSQAIALDRALDAACLRLQHAGSIAVDPHAGPGAAGTRARVRLFRADAPGLVRQAAALAQVRVLRLEEVRARPSAGPGGDGHDGKEDRSPTNKLG